jgi:hypothetical protein
MWKTSFPSPVFTVEKSVETVKKADFSAVFPFPAFPTFFHRHTEKPTDKMTDFRMRQKCSEEKVN